MSFDIDQLGLVDDMDVAVNASEYVPAAAPMPLAAGIYGFRVVPENGYAIRAKSNDEPDVPQLQDGKYISITLKMIEIVDPVESKRVVALYQDIRTKPRPRTNFEAGTQILVNDLGDLIRSADPSASFSGMVEGYKLFQALVAQGAIFHAKFDWTARDADAINAELDRISERARMNGEDEKSTAIQTARKAVYKKFTKRGQAKFKNAKGQFVPFLTAQDGTKVDVRVEIPMDGFIDANDLDKVVLGPKFKAKAWWPASRHGHAAHAARAPLQARPALHCAPAASFAAR